MGIFTQKLVTVSIAEMAIVRDPECVIATYALGTCIAICMWDPITHAGGLAHIQLPTADRKRYHENPNPAMYADTAVPAMLNLLKTGKSIRSRLQVKLAGGRTDGILNPRFDIGRKNYAMLRKSLWKYGLLIESEDVGGNQPRTVYLHLSSGVLEITSKGKSHTI